tara:strand:- start:32 stop:1495 length:1464 start_codon:yes stop_codon:yes gene_type:complete
MDVRMPDGTIIKNVPEGTTKAQLDTKLARSPYDAPKGFVERSYDSIAEGFSGAKEAIVGGDSGDLYQDPASRVSRALGGELIPAVASVAGDAVMTAGRALLPTSVQGSVGEVYDSVVQSAPAQMLGQGIGAAQEAAPDLTAKIGETINIFGGLSKGTKVPKLDIPKPAIKNKAINRVEHVQTMLEPDNLDGPGKITTEGRLKTKTYNPVDYEKRMYEEVSSVKGVKPQGNFTDNFNAVSDAVEVLANKLDKRLEGLDSLGVSSVRTSVANTANALERTNTMVGNAGEAGRKVFEEFNARLTEFGEGVSPKDLLQLRRDLDKWANPKGTVFDPQVINGTNIAMKTIRDQINDLIVEAAPTKGVRESLRKQSDLLTARDIMRPRSINERGNAITRTIQALENDTGVRHPTTPLAAQANVTSKIAATTTALLAAGWGITKGLSKEARLGYTKLLGETERLINLGGRGVETLKADRLIILSILNGTEDEPE